VRRWVCELLSAWSRVFELPALQSAPTKTGTNSQAEMTSDNASDVNTPHKQILGLPVVLWYSSAVSTLVGIGIIGDPIPPRGPADPTLSSH
jgi:hypothetical protein